MTIQVGLFVLVFVVAVSLFVKTHRSGSSSTNSIAHVSDSTPSERR